jgi:iron complex outermembrane receptor protein
LKISGGLRHSDVRFESLDRFIVGPNPDDSGSARYHATLPVLGAVLRLGADTNVFASIGRGFETPTFVELAYRPDGTPGLNFDLQAATSRNAEIGVRSRLAAGVSATATLFGADTRDEIVSATSSGGRNTFTNAERTRRQGLELSVEAVLGEQWEAMASYTYTDAEFRRYVTVAGVDLSGRGIPGVPRHSSFAELKWRDPGSGLSSAVELRSVSKLPANDAGTAFAGSYTVANWRLGFDGGSAAWRYSAYLRVDNLFDSRYVGSVIVNEANQRYFEPAPTRAAYVGGSVVVVF